MRQKLAAMSAKRKCDTVHRELVRRIRAKGLANPEQKGRPVILLEGGIFLVMYEGTLTPLAKVDLRTLCAFSVDVHGDGASDPASANRYATNRTLDTENLSCKEFCAFCKVLKACIDAEARKKLEMDAAVASIAEA